MGNQQPSPFKMGKVQRLVEIRTFKIDYFIWKRGEEFISLHKLRFEYAN